MIARTIQVAFIFLCCRNRYFKRKKWLKKSYYGTAEGFKISEKWVCQMVGIDSTNKNSMASYRKARMRYGLA